MGFLKFNKIPKHRVFNYVPRYYDPAKDERDAIINNAKIKAGLIDPEDLDNSVENAKYRISRSFQDRTIADKHKRKTQRNANIRVVVIILILTAIAYIILNVNMDGLVKLLE